MYGKTLCTGHDVSNFGHILIQTVLLQFQVKRAPADTQQSSCRLFVIARRPNAFRIVARSARSSLSEYTSGCLSLPGRPISVAVIQPSFASRVARLTTVLSSRMFPATDKPSAVSVPRDQSLSRSFPAPGWRHPA